MVFQPQPTPLTWLLPTFFILGLFQAGQRALSKEKGGLALGLYVLPAPGHPCWRLLGGMLGLEPSSVALRLDSPTPNTSWDKCQSEHSLCPVLHTLIHHPHFSVGKTESRRGCDLPKTKGSVGSRWTWHLVLPLSSSGTNENSPPRQWAGWGLRVASRRQGSAAPEAHGSVTGKRQAGS